MREQLLKRNDATIAAAAAATTVAASGSLTEEYRKINSCVLTETETAKEAGLPEEVHVYHSLYRMEDKPGKVLGHSSWVYKAVCRTNGKYYTMVRIEGTTIVCCIYP